MGMGTWMSTRTVNFFARIPSIVNSIVTSITRGRNWNRERLPFRNPHCWVFPEGVLCRWLTLAADRPSSPAEQKPWQCSRNVEVQAEGPSSSGRYPGHSSAMEGQALTQAAFCPLPLFPQQRAPPATRAQTDEGWGRAGPIMELNRIWNGALCSTLCCCALGLRAIESAFPAGSRPVVVRDLGLAGRCCRWQLLFASLRARHVDGVHVQGFGVSLGSDMGE